MRTELHKVVVCLAAVVMAVGLAACGEREEAQKDELLEIISATRPLAREFVYVDQPQNGTEIRVVGVVEDSFRFKARLSVNNQPIKEEVAVDDALAVRFLDATHVGLFLDEERSAEAMKAPESADGAPVPTPLETLQAGRWVLDPTGAPSLLPRADAQRLEGEDPVLDALAVLDYVAQIVEANGAVRYNKDALEPVYKPAEDRFPKPAQGAAVTRYDVPLRKFPKASDQGGKNVVIVPGVENFRKLSVFVRDGRVIEIREDIDVASRMDDLRRNFDVKTQFTVEQAVTAINEVRKSKGEDPFRPRRMQLQLVFEDEESVSLPEPGAFIQAPLSFLRHRGADVPARKGAGAESFGDATGDGDTSTTTAVEASEQPAPSA
ncbi:MAG TPA: hypothetical protein VM345_11160 [Acidimicrobiales bacterium]|jgi:hypothetical protein|nr:hypothetical protein [Acidimicrobiales bacterium]